MVFPVSTGEKNTTLLLFPVSVYAAGLAHVVPASVQRGGQMSACCVRSF